MKVTERKEVLVVYEQQIGITLRSRSLYAQARIARKISDRIDTIGVISQKA